MISSRPPFAPDSDRSSAGSRFRLVLGLTNLRTDEECGRILLDRYVCVHLDSHADKQECLIHMMRKLYAYVQVRAKAPRLSSACSRTRIGP